jgi:hypothetical protein
LPTDLVEDNLDVLVGDDFGVTEDDVLATFDGDLTVVDFGNESEGISAGMLVLIAAFFLLQPKVIRRDNITNSKSKTYTALSKTCCLYVFISKYPKTIDERSNYLVFFTGLGVEGAALSNVLQSDDKINLGTKTYTRFLPDEGVLGLILGFLGESLVGLEERIVC